MALERLDRILAGSQAVSGLAFSGFTLLHLAGHASSILSFSLADTALYAFREIYQDPIVEPLLIGGCLIAHITASAGRVALRFVRKNARAQKSVKDDDDRRGDRKPKDGHSPAFTLALRELKLHRLSGYVVGVAILGHIYAARLVPLRVLPDPSIIDLTFITYGLQQSPLLYFPYYTIFSTAALYHTLYGIPQALSFLGLWSPKRKFKPGRWTKVMMASAGLMIATVIALGGQFEDIAIPLASKWAYLSAQI
ncbi:hypothetical protein BC832DRAFT_618888 [Gaertneriomyces semiglobifer]|nr:hypothetical protein BC832DRAFT_618888 [Gaertneriomyces semiglobifer]